MAEFEGFPPAAQRFFRGLARNNTKAWFEKNRAIYETAIREPMKGLVEAVDVALADIAPEIVGDPRRSLFRIHRDIRFSKDKSPYKTNAGCWFYHRDAGRGVGQEAEGGAGFYFHLDGRESFFAAGAWMPSRPSLNRLRDTLAEKWRSWEAIVAAPAFRRRFGTLDPESRLTRVPRGYPADHPAADWLRYQSFTVSVPVPTSALGSAALVRRLGQEAVRLTPFVRWLNGALGFEPARTRF